MDGTENQKDSPTQEASEGTKGTSNQPETYTTEQRDKAVSDALSAAGRDAKSIAEQRAEATRLYEEAKKVKVSLGAERAQWQKEKDAAKLEAARDNPDTLSSVQAKQKQRDREAELARREEELKSSEAKHRAELDDLGKLKNERNALEVATRLNVDAELLLKFTDGSTKAMEELAAHLPKKGEVKPPLKPDSGTTVGGDTMPDSAQGKMKAGWAEFHKS